jgi:hypothetical protein
MRVKVATTLVMAAMLAGGAAACSNQKVAPTSDEFACVYGPIDKGQQLVDQVAPGSEVKQYPKEDSVVYIPTSNRFYMASADRNVADPGAPNWYTGFGKGHVEMQVQGQFRFRFNQDRICEWYSKHGRRNADEDGDLQFNKRGDASTGWARWLNENFGVTGQQAVRERASAYDWEAATLDLPVNADPDTSEVPEGVTPGEATDVVIGTDVGKTFTQELNANLGGQYFCGIDVSVTGESGGCPDIVFQTIKVEPSDKDLLSSLQKLEAQKQELRNTQASAKLFEAQKEATLAAEAAHQELLAAQLQTALLQAQFDNAKCLVFAKLNLDCEGHFAPIVVGGQQVGTR